MAALDKNDEWKMVDRNQRDIASRRAALDAEEARWLREAERLQIWRELGMVSALDYMERVLGYAPHAALERLRVARSLGALPLLEAALDAGDLCFSAVRELSRVATPGTEAAWLGRALSKNLRQIEELVAGHAQGDLPDDVKNPSLELRPFKLLLAPEVFARVRQTQAALAEEHGGRLDDNALATAFCEAVLSRATADGEPTGRAKFQILMTVCSRCQQGYQEGSGVQVPVDAAAVERARCDAQYIGSTSDSTPVRATQDIPPKVVRFVWRRDGGRCQTPGCRSAADWRSIISYRAPMAARMIRPTFTCDARRVIGRHIAGRSSSMASRWCGRMRRRRPASARPTWDRDSTRRSFARKRAMHSSASGGSRTSRALRWRKQCPTWDANRRSRI
ncbi:MAG: hypothetical protein M4D80_03580 [Myxococcota bacterium]|nr:hypothetical protein [Myxococcota bacterium]